VLFGDVNPGGKLPITFPARWARCRSTTRTRTRAAVRREGTSKYLDVPVTPQFPFGHGLSYMTFELSGLKGGAGAPAPIGRRRRGDGEEHGPPATRWQIYVTDVAASVTRPV
jgi:beta-glucosidase